MAEQVDYASPLERRRTVIVHRIGTAVFVLLLIAALIGLVGDGPLSGAQSGSDDSSLRVEYRRFVHYQGPATLNLRVSAGTATNGIIHLQLSRIFVEKVEIERIEPEPESATVGTQFITYAIRTETNQAAAIKVRFQANHFGRLHYRAGLSGRSTVQLQHFAYP